jgi:cytochrome c oxidase subunit 3
VCKIDIEKSVQNNTKSPFVVSDGFFYIHQGIFFTVLLGIYLSALQAYEYTEAPFTTGDTAYGSTLFIAAGFHGLHVLITTTSLITCLPRQTTLHFSSNHHFGFEATV